ncbi:MAG: hypothetical protein NVV66_16375 [Cellulomonas sp.]|nr:hypothetical protein [Cellulomonas sp.]
MIAALFTIFSMASMVESRLPERDGAVRVGTAYAHVEQVGVQYTSDLLA